MRVISEGMLQKLKKLEGPDLQQETHKLHIAYPADL
jgi:hypothetical protein